MIDPSTVMFPANTPGATPGAAETAPMGQLMRFEEAMAAGKVPAGTEAGPGDWVIAPQEATSSVDGPVNLGDRILNGVERIHQDHAARRERVKEMVSATQNTEFNFSRAMDLQMEVMQMNLVQDVTTKTADKGSQGVQTLFRNQ